MDKHELNKLVVVTSLIALFLVGFFWWSDQTTAKSLKTGLFRTDLYNDSYETPMPPNLLANIKQVAGGTNHTCVLTNSGGVKCWGGNRYGQLGDGTTTDRYVPTNVSGLDSGVINISAGRVYTCAVLSGGSAKCWGENAAGQLGDGTTTDRLVPTNVVQSFASAVLSISAGIYHTCGVTVIEAKVRCWGLNVSGQLGDGTTTNRLVPTEVSGLTDVTTVSAHGGHTCAFTNAGGMKCWGANGLGQLGDGTTTGHLVPTDVLGLASGVKSIATSNSYTCAVTGSSGVKCWGTNDEGQLGDGTTIDRLVPTDVAGLTSGVDSVSTQNSHTCALTSTGGVKCWGNNENGQLGDGSTTERVLPTDVAGLATGITSISVALYHTCALTTSGGVKCLGWNGYGQLGDGTTTDRHVATDVIDPSAPQTIDSGFRPNPDGFVFANTGVYISPPTLDQIAGWYPNALQSVDPVKFFGDDVCAYTIGESCALRWDVAQWRKTIVDDATAGFCLGMALDSIFYREDTPRPHGASSTYGLSYNDAVPSIINSFAWQYVPEIRGKNLDYADKNVAETLQLIQDQLSQGRAISILLYDPSAYDPSKGPGAHAVVGYKLEPLGSDAYKLWLYDNTFPTGDHFAIFTPTLDTATYAWPDRVWRLVRAIPTNVFSGQYTWKTNSSAAFTASPEMNPPTMLVVPANTTVVVNGVTKPIQYIANGLGYASSGTVLLEPNEIVNTVISLGAASAPALTQDIAVFGGGKALDVSGLHQNDVIKLVDTLQSVHINTQQGSTPVVSFAGDIALGNSQATVSTIISNGSSITVTLTDAASLTVRSDKNTLQTASIEMKVLQPTSKTETLFVYSDLDLSSATGLTFALGTSTNGVVDYTIERPSGNSNGTLTNQIQPRAFLPLIRR